ncbi:retrotransposon protein [Cucumis melo var. makuwa]|uniref:Retrotransposon protein n=1 Tax=Cucumis melo var. makuwa TaxID=1194695 RepID=A0A5A7SKJ7_CUCMM|nr:retrotransposon protein [Cucumis melo var. makuwa]TYK30718.1 retrotransposon protein [Cucumis melo var. makuwa]
MTYCDNVDDVDEGDSEYTMTTASKDIHYIETTNEWFRPGYLAQLVCMMAEKLPGCRVRATTVIDYRIKTLKWTFQAFAEMRGPSEGLLNKLFPYYEKLTYVFGRDRTVGRFAETFADVVSNEPVEMMYAHHDLLALQMVGPDRVDPRGRREVSERWMVKAYIWRSTKRTSNSG